MFETLLGGVFGGLLRLAPEVLKWLDRKDERKHELAMIDREMELQRLNAQSRAHEVDAQVTMREFDALGEAFKEQASTAKAAGWFVAALSALARPTITYAFVGAYFLIKAATYLLAVEQGGNWRDVVISLWSQDDVTIMFMIVSFWFVGRTLDRR